jgi:hypothetical protein
MKTGSIASNLVALSLGAFFTACGGAEMNDGSQLSNDNVGSDEVMSSFDSVEQEATVCDDPQYDHWKYLSGLAVAAANELGRWNAAKDFVKENTNNNPRIFLSSEGSARCNPVGCPNVTAILNMQNMDSSTVVRHDPLLLRQYMVTYFDRQKGSVAPDHTLTPAGTASDVCGLRYFFNVAGATTTTTTTSGISGTSELKANSASKCVDIVGVSGNDGAQVQQYTCSGSSNQKFTVEANGSYYRLKANNSGKCLGVVNSSTSDGSLLEQRSCGANNSQNFTLTSKGNGTFELKNASSGKCVDIQGGGTADGQKAQIYACHGGANQTFQAPGLTSGSTTSTSTTTSSVTPSNLWNYLTFAGGNENKYLMFQSSTTQVSIDPMGTMIDGGSAAASGGCWAGATKVSTTNISGSCCTINSAYGTLQQLSTQNPNMYKCVL